MFVEESFVVFNMFCVISQYSFVYDFLKSVCCEQFNHSTQSEENQ